MTNQLDPKLPRASNSNLPAGSALHLSDSKKDAGSSNRAGNESHGLKRKSTLMTPSSPEKKKIMTQRYKLVNLTSAKMFTGSSTRNKGYNALALSETQGSGKFSILHVTAWTTTNSTRSVESLQQMTPYRTYEAHGMHIGHPKVGLNFNDTTLNINLATRIKEDDTHEWNLTQTQATVSNRVTPISSLDEQQDRTEVLINARVIAIEKDINHTTLRAKVKVYDASQCSVEVAVFIDNVAILSAIKANDTILFTAKTRKYAGRTTLALGHYAINVNENAGQELIPSIAECDASRFMNLSQNTQQLFGLLSMRPSQTVWFSLIEVTVERVGGDYVNFFCPDCENALWFSDSTEMWHCGTHGSIEDKSVLFKSQPILDLILDGQQVKNVSVKFGQELELFGATCEEIVQTGCKHSPIQCKFNCTIGVGPKNVVVLHLKKLSASIFQSSELQSAQTT